MTRPCPPTRPCTAGSNGICLRCFFRQVRGIDEEGLRQGMRHTGPDVQRGAGIPGGEGLGGAESQLLHAETLKGLARRAGRELASAGKRGDRHRVHQKMRRLDNLRSRLARVEADMAVGLVRLCFGGRKLCAASTTWRPTGIPAMRNGWPVGGMPAAASSSCWAAGTRPAAASCAWLQLLTMAP